MSEEPPVPPRPERPALVDYSLIVLVAVAVAVILAVTVGAQVLQVLRTTGAALRG